MIDIKDISGNKRFSTSINEGSKRRFQLMKEDFITLKFSVAEPVYFKMGDFVECDFGLFELVDLQKPTFNTSTGAYDYELRLDAYYWKWKNKIFKFTPEVGGKEASWNLTASLAEHLEVFLRNLKALGYKYHGVDFEFEPFIDKTVSDTSKFISYDKANLINALHQMAEAWECEWWIVKNEIHFGRCEHGDPVNFELGKNVSTMGRSDSQSTYATRIFAFGSTRNIPLAYRKKLIFNATNVTGRYISDSNRKLSTDYFPTDAVQKYEYAAKRNLSYTFNSSSTTFNKTDDYKIADNPGNGTYRISGKGAEFNLSTALSPSNLYLTEGNYIFKSSLVYELNGVEKEISIGGSTVIVSKDQRKTIVEALKIPEKIELEKNTSNLRIRTYFSIPGFNVPLLMTQVSFAYDLKLKNAASSADAVVTFTSGINAGKTFQSKYNPDLISGDNTILLPEGVTASIGDKYTIDNIVKSKVPANYFTDDRDSQTVEGIVTKHLMMPESVPFIDAYPDMTEEEAVEQVIVFDDIYAKREGTVGGVFVHPYTDTIDNPDGTKTEKSWNAYRFKDADLSFHFSKDYKIAGEELRIVFQTGTLAGMDFEVKFNPYDSKSTTDKPQPEKNEDGTWNANAQVFEIIRNDDYGRNLPDDILHPDDNKGNQYILYGYDPQFVSDKFIPEAEKELEKAAREYIQKLKEDPSTYDVTMDSEYIYGINPETGEQDPAFTKKFDVGQKVNLINKAYFENGRESRIIGYEYPLDIPYDHPVYTIGETASYSRLAELESKVESLTYRKDKKQQVIVNNGSSSSGDIGGDSIPKLQNTLSVTASAVGYIKSGDILTAGTTLEDIFRKMLIDAQTASAQLKGSISTSNDVEYGTPKGTIAYTAIRGGQGPMIQAYYDGDKNNVLVFSEEVGGIQTATRQLTGIYTERDTYKATVVFGASDDGKVAEKTLTDTISVNVHRLWFAGVCDSIPTTSAQVRALASNGTYSGAGTYKFSVGEWHIIVICIPNGSVSDVSRTKTPGNYLESPGVFKGTRTIPVEGANNSQAADYTMYIFQVDTISDSDTFTFKTN